MGILDRLLGQPPELHGLAAGHATLDTRGAVGFAAQRIEPGVRPDRRTLARNTARSAEQWNAYEGVGEIGYVVDFFGNAMRRVRVFPAGIDDPDDGRIPLEECSWCPEGLARDAAIALDRIRSSEHGQGEVLAQMAVNLKVAGAGNLYATRDPDTEQEDWSVISTDALQFVRGQWVIKQTPDDRKPTPVNLATDPIWKFWQRHSRWPGLAYSEMGRVLGHAENLQILERAARNRARSRAAGAGVLVMSNRYKLNGRRNPNGPTGGDLFDDFMTAGTTAMQDEAAVSAFMPIMVDFDVDDARKVMHHVTLDRPLSEVEEKREEKLLRRIGQGLDAPPELVTGFHDVKFANGLIIQQETYEAHCEPLALRIADILAITAVHSALRALGHPAELIARVLVGVNPADLVRDPTEFDHAKSLHEALVISDEALRRAGRYNDDDAPKADELLRRMALKRGTTTEALTTELLEKYAEADISRTIAKVEAQTAEIEAGTDAAEAETEEATGPADEDVTAAATPPASSDLGARLQAIDDDLTARVTGAAEMAITHALTRATSRAANRARGTSLAAIVRHGGRGLEHRLGPDGLAELRFAAGDLVTDQDFDDLRDQWGSWVAAAYASGAQQVTTATGQPVDLEGTDAASDAGWSILLAGLLVAARLALATDPDVATTTDGTDTGEANVSATIQPGLIRHALSTAGGAAGQVTDGGAVLVQAGTRPAGLVATGEQIIAAAGEAGLVLTGHVWRTGAPAVIFPPHHDLNGVTFASHDDPALANESGQWPGNGHWYVGDHAGCRCTAEPVFEPISNN
jgi:hypothetical protein